MTHIYLNHIEGVKSQLKRKPTQFPKLTVKRKVDNIEDFEWEDISLEGYVAQPNIRVIWQCNLFVTT